MLQNLPLFHLLFVYATIDHIEEFGTSRAPLDITKKASSSLTSHPPILINSGLPPVPTKLVMNTQEGIFIEMADLLPQRLISAEYYRGDSSKHTHEVTNIIEWV